jgi:hypothetical protein
MFNSLTKSTIITAISIVAVFVGIAGILQLLSFQVRDESEELYDFTTSAKLFHEKIDKTDLLENIPALVEIITQSTSNNASEVELTIRNGALSAKGYREQFNWLRTTSASLDLHTSLIREGHLIESCYSKLNLINTIRQSKDESNWKEQLEEVVELYENVVSLREENRMEIERLLQ